MRRRRAVLAPARCPLLPLLTGQNVKIFVSGKIGAEVGPSNFMRQLENLGYSVTFDWTEIPHLRPYEVNIEQSMNAARLEIKGVASADALVLLSHERGVGMFVELGAALALDKPVIAVSSKPVRTMFLFHPNVTIVSSTVGALEALGELRARLERDG